MSSELKTNKFEIELTGKWTAELLRGMADVVDILERIPPQERQDSLNTAMRLVDIDKNRSGIKLVVNNGQ